MEELVKENLSVPDNLRDVPKMDKFITSMWETNNEGFTPDGNSDENYRASRSNEEEVEPSGICSAEINYGGITGYKEWKT